MIQRRLPMRVLIPLITALFLASLCAPYLSGVPAYGESGFSTFFTDETLRVDYYHAGDAAGESILLDRLYHYGGWAGSVTNLIDPDNMGSYRLKVYDSESKKLLFSREYGTLFEEYRSTKSAIDGQKKAFQECALIPYPRKKIIFSIEARDKKQQFNEIFHTMIDPEDMNIIRRPPDPEVEVRTLLASGDPHQKVDVLFVGEGFTRTERDKFFGDSRRLMERFFQYEPYKSMKSHFNFRAVLKPSAQSGCDEPSYGSFRNTSVGCSFDSLGSERYLLTENTRELRNICSHAPCDAIIILVNTSRYGGGGIYNLYATVVTDSQWTDYVLIHEFGHHFAGLGDEYYTSQVGFNDFYPAGMEPLSPNITALRRGFSLKWGDLVQKGTSIPTPWDKDRFEKQDRAYQEFREKMNEKKAAARKSHLKEEEILKISREQENLSRESSRKTDAILRESPNYGRVGAFEGAGYQAKGLFRPMVDCIMFTKACPAFCEVCRKALEKKILSYSL